MLDPKLYRKSPGIVRREIKIRNLKIDFDKFLDLDGKYLKLLKEVEELRQNKTKENKDLRKKKEKEFNKIKLEWEKMALQLPNISQNYSPLKQYLTEAINSEKRLIKHCEKMIEFYESELLK